MTHRSVQAEVALCTARGFAVADYAYHEEALCHLFAYLMGVPLSMAGIPFFRLNNARARLDIIDRLLKKKCGTTYRTFWTSVKAQLKQLDEQRNKIVHWTTVVTHHDVPVVSLVPPNHWDADENTPSLLEADLIEFASRCRFYCNVLSYFLYHLEGQSFVTPDWAAVFQREVVYPPPTGHPLHRPS